jgi:zinc protease
MKGMRASRIAAVAMVLIAAATAGLQAQSFEVKTYQLKNGMKILVQEDHSIPSIAFYIFYRIGARNERPGTTGISHFFEHMMFNGAKKYGPGAFDRTMEAAGGSNNAYTSKDMTAYQDWFPPSALDLIFDLEADRIQYLSFDPKIIESERGVIVSERRSGVDSSNFGILNEQLWATAFTAHPYQWPVVGWMVDIEHWSLEDLRRHFQTGYSPSNATMVVTGDVTGDEIFRLATRYIEPIPSHDPPAKVTTAEPEQMGERRVVVRKFAQLPILMIGYHVPAASDPSYYALQILQTILFSGQSSRMYQRLVDKDQIAISVSGGSGISFDPTLFSISAQPKAGVLPEVLEKAIYEELDKVKEELVSETEISKARNIQLAQFYRQMKTINGRANALGTYEVFFGDYNKLFSAADEYSRVTREQVREIALKCFHDRNRTVATLVPDPAASGKK